MFDILITNGRIVDGTGNPWYRADLGITGAKIQAIGSLQKAEHNHHIDANDNIVCPGFIDAHVHGDLALFSDPFHEPAIRQGVTTYILGQDGVAMAPGSAATLDYMRRYTAGFSGVHSIPTSWGSMAEYLECLDGHTALNVACLVPNGNLRMEVMGLETRPPRADEIKEMRRLARIAMEEGAIGLSSGLDYIPSRYAQTEELTSLCEEIAPFGGVYVTHMRAYTPRSVLESMEEVFHIGRQAKVPVHISHFNSQAKLVLPKVDEGIAQGIDVTYDLYCYLAGNSILGMIALPPAIQEGGIEPTLQRLADAIRQNQHRDWFANPRGPLEKVQLAFVASPKFKHLEGKTLEEAVDLEKMPIGDLICTILLASKMAVGCIAPHLERGEEDIEEMMVHPAMMAGSDGIYAGNFPHPRGYGCFARYLGYYVRDRKTWKLEEAVRHLSSHPAQRFGLRDRGLLRPGLAADIVVFDPEKIADLATFKRGNVLATGVEHVLINGQLVLLQGNRTTALPGRALKP